MLDQIKGLHHVTSMANDARQNNEFFTKKLGLRRVKKTVNFDAPDVYHLYYADEVGTPGSVMTYFPFPNIGKGRHGVGEVGTTVYSVPEGTLGYWEKRFADEGVTGLSREEKFGEKRLAFVINGPNALARRIALALHLVDYSNSIATLQPHAEPRDRCYTIRLCPCCRSLSWLSCRA